MRRAICLLLNRTLLARPHCAAFKFSTAQKGFNEQQFTELSGKQEKKKKITSGRAWRTEELRLKSNEDLHKLWFICVKEKNLLLADRVIEEKFSGTTAEIDQRLDKVKRTMRRILGVINERQIIKRKYKEELENQYVEKKKVELQSRMDKEEVPEITWEMLRAKYHSLRKGVDNVKYLEKIWAKKEENEVRRERMEERLSQSAPKDFNSFWDYEMSIGQRPLQEEILRSHITNWKGLNLKQRKIILGFLNARRAKDAKASFVKELKILGQAIAHQELKSRIQDST